MRKVGLRKVGLRKPSLEQMMTRDGAGTISDVNEETNYDNMVKFDNGGKNNNEVKHI